MPVLDDGTVIPSFFGVSDRSCVSPGPLMTMTDTSIRVGEITASYDVDDPQNQSKSEREYCVMVNHRDADSPLIQQLYRCTLRDGFGAQGDHFRHSLRPSSSPQKDKAVTDGAIVLIACPNGDKSQAVILDCIKQPNRTTKDPKGRFLSFEFNGISVEIGDDGGFKMTVPGPTTSTGAPDQRDNDNHGTSLEMNAAGDVEISDHNGESIKISPGAKTIEVLADTHKTTCDSQWTLRAQKVVVVADEVNLGADNLMAMKNGVVLGGGIDTFTGTPYYALGSASNVVKAKG
jgi:hypothetical protein